MNNFGVQTEANFINAISAAHEIIKSYGIAKPEEIDLEAIAMDKGLFVKYAPLIGAEARLVKKGNRGIIRVNNETKEEGKRRFSIAHELGHWMLHPDKSQFDLYSDQGISSYYGSIEEQEANIFAAHLLMPRFMFLPRIEDVEPNLKKISQLAEEFNTTLTSAIVRYIDETQWKCAAVFSEDGIIKWYKKSESCFEIYFNRKEKVPLYTLAWCYENGKAVPEQGERIEAEFWLKEKYASSYETILEQAVRLGAYKAILSLLWLD